MPLQRRQLLAGAAATLVLPAQAVPWPAGAPRFQAGMSFAHLHRPGRGYGSNACQQQLQHLAGCGVSHVALMPFGYQRTVDATAVRFGPRLDPTLTDDHLRRAIEQAHSVGLRVWMKPHIWSGAFWRGGASRQDFAPANGAWAAWFQSYTGFARHYARLAAETGCEGMCLGLEYLKATQQNPGAWGRVAKAVRTDFSGLLTYAANWYAEAEAFTDWSAFDFVGVQAYAPLVSADVDDPSETQLRSGWERVLAPWVELARKNNRPLLLTEAGVRPIRGAAARPWDHSLEGPEDRALQAAATRALCMCVQRCPEVAGVYWWKWFSASQGEGKTLDYDMQGTPAEQVLREQWKRPLVPDTVVR